MRTILIAFLICLFSSRVSSVTAAEAKWISLFDDRSIEGWSNPFDWGAFAVEEGEIVLRGDRKYFLVSDHVYRDFELEVELFVPPGGNSGIQFRCVFMM
tara:strand:- start:28 stop:324 length:297 start_codon:yes stop_codon:yes gene_type:complete